MVLVALMIGSIVESIFVEAAEEPLFGSVDNFLDLLVGSNDRSIGYDG